MTKHTISSSDGLSLHFQDRLTYERFKNDEERLFVKYYNEIRGKHGIWATNQNKFVASIDELNRLDSRYMENLRAKYLSEPENEDDQA